MLARRVIVSLFTASAYWPLPAFIVSNCVYMKLYIHIATALISTTYGFVKLSITLVGLAFAACPMSQRDMATLRRE
jgi:hypothetical protein